MPSKLNLPFIAVLFLLLMFFSEVYAEPRIAIGVKNTLNLTKFNIDPLLPDEPLADTEWAEASGVLRTFPFQLDLGSPDWSGMDGFFAARLKRTG